MKNILPFARKELPPETIDEIDMQIALACLRKLPDDHRAALRAYYYHGLSREKSAAIGHMGESAFTQLTIHLRKTVNAAILRSRPKGARRFFHALNPWSSLR
jgi:DNA-directed RNA polymerase specialized sigma24 family protein